jgi:hypothetical protein
VEYLELAPEILPPIGIERREDLFRVGVAGCKREHELNLPGGVKVESSHWIAQHDRYLEPGRNVMHEVVFADQIACCEDRCRLEATLAACCSSSPPFLHSWNADTDQSGDISPREAFVCESSQKSRHVLSDEIGALRLPLLHDHAQMQVGGVLMQDLGAVGEIPCVLGELGERWQGGGGSSGGGVISLLTVPRLLPGKLASLGIA